MTVILVKQVVAKTTPKYQISSLGCLANILPCGEKGHRLLQLEALHTLWVSDPPTHLYVCSQDDRRQLAGSISCDILEAR